MPLPGSVRNATVSGEAGSWAAVGADVGGAARAGLLRALRVGGLGLAPAEPAAGPVAKAAPRPLIQVGARLILGVQRGSADGEDIGRAAGPLDAAVEAGVAGGCDEGDAVVPGGGGEGGIEGELRGRFVAEEAEILAPAPA